MVTTSANIVRDLYQSFIEDDVEMMRFIQKESAVYGRLRERVQYDPLLVEVCCEILFDNVKEIKFLFRRIEDGKRFIESVPENGREESC